MLYCLIGYHGISWKLDGLEFRKNQLRINSAIEKGTFQQCFTIRYERDWGREVHKKEKKKKAEITKSNSRASCNQSCEIRTKALARARRP